MSVASTDWEWILKAGMGDSANSGASVECVTTNRTIDGVAVTSVFVTVTMMISNRANYVAYPPQMLRGLEPGSSSSNYNERVSSWTSETFKVQGRLPNGLVDNIWRPIRWFTLCPGSFGAADSDHPFSRRIELPAPADSGYDWDAFPGVNPIYRFSIDEVLGPVTVYQLNDRNALLHSPASAVDP